MRAPKGQRVGEGDCDDDNALVNPGVAELCNGIDDDCDGPVDFDDDLENSTWYGDADGDGYGLDTVAKVAPGCEPPEGYAAAAGDCDDSDAAVNPDGAEVYAMATTTTATSSVDDADGSLDGELYLPGRGQRRIRRRQQARPSSRAAHRSGTSSDATDCDDLDATVNPDAIEGVQRSRR